MSTEVIGTTQIRDMLILKKTLEEMGISFQELSEETLAWGTRYNRMQVNVATGQIKYDSMNKSQVQELQQQYGKQFIMYEIAKKGHCVESVQTVGDNIEIIAGY